MRQQTASAELHFQFPMKRLRGRIANSDTVHFLPQHSADCHPLSAVSAKQLQLHRWHRVQSKYQAAQMQRGHAGKETVAFAIRRSQSHSTNYLANASHGIVWPSAWHTKRSLPVSPVLPAGGRNPIPITRRTLPPHILSRLWQDK